MASNRSRHASGCGSAWRDARGWFKHEIERFQGSLAGLAEIVVFIALGLTIDITHLSGETWLHGAALALVLAVVARPLAVALTHTSPPPTDPPRAEPPQLAARSSRRVRSHAPAAHRWTRA